MKELKIGINKSGTLKNKHNHYIKLARNSNGCFIFTESEKYGPFERIFIDKDKNGNELIIGYRPFQSEYYKMTEKGINLEDQVRISIEELTKIKPKEVNFDGCIILGKVNGHAILFDDNVGMFFAVNTLEDIKPYDQYSKFDSYKELCEHYSKINISLYDQALHTLANKQKKSLINFDNLFSCIKSLNVSDLDDELIFDIVKDRNIEKKFFSKYQDRFISEGKTTQMTNDLLNKGYKEIRNPSYAITKRDYPNEINLFSLLLQKKVNELKENCVLATKENNYINFEILTECFKEVSIKEISSDAQKEISAGRPLTRSVFLEILIAAFNKMRDRGENISNYYQNTNTFRTLYPNQYDQLWEVGLVKLNQLYDEYYIEKAKSVKK